MKNFNLEIEIDDCLKFLKGQDNNNTFKLLNKNIIDRIPEIISFFNKLTESNGCNNIFIDGDWGSGKTWFVKLLQAYFENYNDIDIHKNISKNYKTSLDSDNNNNNTQQYLTVYFNAWENDYIEDPLVAIFLTLKTEIKRYNEQLVKAISENLQETKDNVQNKIHFPSENSAENIIIEILDEVCKVASFKNNPFSIGRSIFNFIKEDRFKKSYIQNISQKFEDASNLRDGVNQYLKKLCDGKHKIKIIFFIDELDRCKPEYTLKLLESTKNLFKYNKVFLVYSVNMRELSNSLEGIYGNNFNGGKYLSKFYDYKYTLIPANLNNYLTSRNLNNIPKTYINFIAELSDIYNTSLRDVNIIASEVDSTIYKGNNFPSTKISIIYYIYVALIFLKHFNNFKYLEIIQSFNSLILYELLMQSEHFMIAYLEAYIMINKATENELKKLITECLKIWFSDSVTASEIYNYKTNKDLKYVYDIIWSLRRQVR